MTRHSFVDQVCFRDAHDDSVRPTAVNTSVSVSTDWAPKNLSDQTLRVLMLGVTTDLFIRALSKSLARTVSKDVRKSFPSLLSWRPGTVGIWQNFIPQLCHLCVSIFFVIDFALEVTLVFRRSGTKVARHSSLKLASIIFELLLCKSHAARHSQCYT